jgi:hypothetical protein
MRLSLIIQSRVSRCAFPASLLDRCGGEDSNPGTPSRLNPEYCHVQTIDERETGTSVSIEILTLVGESISFATIFSYINFTTSSSRLRLLFPRFSSEYQDTRFQIQKSFSLYLVTSEFVVLHYERILLLSRICGHLLKACEPHRRKGD